jgi:hypothetical protein
MRYDMTRRKNLIIFCHPEVTLGLSGENISVSHLISPTLQPFITFNFFSHFPRIPFQSYSFVRFIVIPIHLLPPSPYFKRLRYLHPS